MNKESNEENSQLITTIERAEEELSRVLEWIRSGDSRLRFVLPLAITMLGVISALIPSPSSWTLLGGISASFAVFFLGLSVVFCAFSSFPRTSGPLGSMIYFGGIITRDLKQFDSEFRSMTNEQYLTDLLNQIHRNAQIAQAKFTWLQRSIACLFFSLVPWVVGLYEFYSRSY
jgi:hypothetical protein